MHDASSPISRSHVLVEACPARRRLLCARANLLRSGYFSRQFTPDSPSDVTG